MLSLYLFSIAATLVAARVSASGDLELHLMSDANGAKCLDGTPGGYYWRAAASHVNSTKYLLVLNGGGWCRSLEDCANRANTSLGSSKHWDSSISDDGITSIDPTYNPGFSGWNIAYMYYCDGTSYSSNNETTSMYKDQELHFRGRRLLDAFLEDLHRTRGISNATEVLLTGHSAGGLGAYLQGDNVGDYIYAVAGDDVKFGVVPDAGWFMPLPRANTKDNYYHDYMVQVLGVLGNSSGWVNPGCVAAHASDDPTLCLFAENSYPHTKYNYMPVQSSYDSWQLPNIIGLECLPPKCNSSDLAIAQSFHTSIVASMQQAGALPPGPTRPPSDPRAGSSAWLISCVSHSQMFYGNYF